MYSFTRSHSETALKSGVYQHSHHPDHFPKITISTQYLANSPSSSYGFDTLSKSKQAISPPPVPNFHKHLSMKKIELSRQTNQYFNPTQTGFFGDARTKSKTIHEGETASHTWKFKKHTQNPIQIHNHNSKFSSRQPSDLDIRYEIRNQMDGIGRIQRLESKLMIQLLALKQDKLQLMKDLNEQIARGNQLTRQYKKLQMQYFRLKQAPQQRSSLGGSDFEQETIIGQLKGFESNRNTRINLATQPQLSHYFKLRTIPQSAQSQILKSKSSVQLNRIDQVESPKHIVKLDAQQSKHAGQFSWQKELQNFLKRQRFLVHENQWLRSRVQYLQGELDRNTSRRAGMEAPGQLPVSSQRQPEENHEERKCRYVEYLQLLQEGHAMR